MKNFDAVALKIFFLFLFLLKKAVPLPPQIFKWFEIKGYRIYIYYIGYLSDIDFFKI